MSEFGTGFALEQSFDVAVRNGTLLTVSGRDVIERDVAFTLAREADIRRGGVPDADFRAELEVLIRRILTRDPRITGVRSLSVDLDVAGDAKTAAVDVTVGTADGATDALLIEI
jgi:hypothetical protein